MSSGWGGIAEVAIHNGSVGFCEVWGCYAPTDEYPIEMTLRWTAHGPSKGNIHDEPNEERVNLYLTQQQLQELVSQLNDYLERARRWSGDGR